MNDGDKRRGRAEDLAVSIEFGNDAIVIGISGDLDATTAGDLETVLDSLINEEHQHLVVDLANLGRIDDVGLATIYAACSRLAWTAESMTLRHPTAGARRLLVISGLDDVVEFELVARPADESGTPEVLVGGMLAARYLLTPRPPADPSTIRAVVGSEHIQSALDLLVNLVRASISGVDAVSVRLIKADLLVTIAATGGWVEETSALVGNVLSTPIIASSELLGSLDVLSHDEHIFAMEEREVVAMFAGQIAYIVDPDNAHVSAARLGARLREHAASIGEVSRAEGILIERHGLSADAASKRLQTIASENDLSPAMLALQVIESAARRDRAEPRVSSDDQATGGGTGAAPSPPS